MRRKHSYIRDPKTGALINTDKDGFKRARDRKNLGNKLNAQEEEHQRKINDLSDKINRLEMMVEKLIGN